MNQHTLSDTCIFEGKGLHTGRHAHMSVEPAPPDTGIRFIRTDIGPEASVEALAVNVSGTARSTTISRGKASVATVEHLLSALTGMGIDNARVCLDNAEVPILDGSARPFAESFRKAGAVPQDAPRRFLELSHEVEVRDEGTGAWIRAVPSDRPEIRVTVDFGSRVLGVQSASWSYGNDYISQVAPCRTFVFFHELETLARQGLIRGGDIDNAIVIVEHPVPREQVNSLCTLLGMPALTCTDEGYLDNLRLHFPDECGRHKLLDIIGDLRLAGGWLNASVSAFKPGHAINVQAAKEIAKALVLK